jgi:ribosomal protein L16
MLIPRRVKHRKQHRPHRTGAATGGTRVNFGDYGIQALEPAYVTNRQIESALRRAIHKLPMKCRIVTREGGDI